MTAKLPLHILYLCVLTLVVVGLFVVAGPDRGGVSPDFYDECESVCGGISADSLLAVVEFLAAHETRRFTSQGAASTVSYITRRLTGLGIPVEHNYVNVKDRLGNSVVVTNVLADLSGAGFDLNTLLVCAHYDSRAKDWREPAPGADDNASGVAVLLETARVLAKGGRRPSVTLAFFGGEEDSLLGSKAFAENALDDHPGLRGVVNVDMVGYDEYGPMDAVLFCDPQSIPLAGELVASAARSTRLVIDTTIVSSGNSDHVSFWRKGLPAVSIWEGYDHNPYHNTILDTPEILTPRFLVEITRLVVSASLRLGAIPNRRDRGVSVPGGESEGIANRLIGEMVVGSLPAIDGRTTELSCGGRVLARFSADQDRRTRGTIESMIDGVPGVYLVSRVSSTGSIPTEVIVIE